MLNQGMNVSSQHTKIEWTKKCKIGSIDECKLSKPILFHEIHRKYAPSTKVTEGNYYLFQTSISIMWVIIVSAG